MPKICTIWGKGSIAGRTYKRRGMIKRKGGAGSKIVGKTAREFRPNLQKVKATIKGSTKKIEVCTKCIKAGKVSKS